ncbi:aromatic ring-hydroxylating oxygenase subunit alpha [Reyranella sp.]|jgi:phenylpropionate dioxygenase-like ring-hydroxylating dioxygenase large terminal subunit|uniref:aromatic ring-hydroxylating oxygenase subunit alpha n=1 Tax=Reyranella sp. TaxID=1929291 RepID=UPI002F95D5F5
MSATDSNAVDYRRLVEDRRVHGSLYTDARVFEDELDRIFRRGWVFVGHDSEIANEGDWVTRRLGREPVIMVRAGDGRVHVLANRCAHRGTMLCWQDRGGGRRSFQCSYHGWVFGLDGRLRSLPGRSGFEGALERLDLARPGQVASYRGFVFANQSGDAGPLDDHLGPAGKALIDRALALSPVGRLAIGAGWVGQRVASNWKMWPESDNDGYHLAIAHASLQKAVPGTQYEAALFSPELDNTSQARDHGRGHVELELRSGYDRELAWLGTTRDKVQAYADALAKAHGREMADRLLWDGPPHALIFPNLFLGEMNLAIIQPVGPDETIHYHTPLLLDGVDEALNRRILRQSEAAMGPASFFLPDDAVIAERMQQGWRVDRATADGWVDLGRGVARERRDGGGDGTGDGAGRVGHVSDETTNRGFWRHYRDVMTGRT